MKRIRLGFILSLAFMLLASINVQAQKKGIISGTVIEAFTGEALPGANIYLEGTSIGSTSDLDGNYSIKAIPVGEYVLVVSFIGYENYTESITIGSGANLVKNAKLEFSGGINLDDVIVTAQAKGQMKAINQQLNSSDMKNIVSAERIQELPDANAAEALGRLPGVALERTGGEGSKVIIRGMSPKYTKVLINGIEMPSNSSTFNDYNNSVTSDRSANLSMISPMSLDGIEVIKSPTAEQDGDFVGGMVNFKLRTASEGFNVDALAEGSYNNLKNTYNDYNLNVSISNRFFDNKFGVFLQANMERRNRSSNSLRWDYRNDATAYKDSLAPRNKYLLYNKNVSDVQRLTKRKGATLVFDYKIPQGKIVFSNMFNASPSEVISHGESYGVPNDLDLAKNSMGLYDGISNSNTTLISNSIKYEQSISAFDVDVSFSHSFSGSESTKNNMNSGNNSDPTLDVSGIPNYSNYGPNSTFVYGISNDISIYEQRQLEAAANLAWNFSINATISGKIKTGGKYRTRDKTYDLERMSIEISESPALRSLLMAQYPDDISAENASDRFIYDDINDVDYTSSEFLKGKYELSPIRPNPDFINDVPKHLASINYDDQRGYYNYIPISEMNDYNGTETTQAAYFLAEINITSKFTMIPGVRYEKNETEYTSFVGRDSYILGMSTIIDDTVTVPRDNGYILPNLQLKYEPLSWLQLRFGYSNTLSRPNYNTIIPRTLYSTRDYQVDHKNNKIEPETSRNLDFMVSFKQNYLGLFTVGVFSKDIEGKIYRVSGLYMHDPADFGLDSNKYGGYNISTDLNNSNTTYVKGLEIDLQTSFWYLPGAWKGLVLNTNYTYTNSKATYNTNTQERTIGPDWIPIVTNIVGSFEDRLVDQAAHTVNVALGYDYKGFSGRISMNYQSDMFKGYNLRPEGREYSQPLTRLDLSLKQTLPWLGLQVYANFNNITAAIEEEIQGKELQMPKSSYYYGTTVTLGVRWRLQ